MLQFQFHHHVLVALVLLSLALIQGGACSLENTPTQNDFMMWMKKFERNYATLEEFDHRYSVFLDNYNYVLSIEDLGSAEYSVFDSPFSDMTKTEFALKYRMGINYDQNKLLDFENAPIVTSVDNVDIPTSWDWRNEGAVTSVKNQESCGSCYIFSAIANIEGQWILAGKGNNLTSFSEEQVMECDKTSCGCYGGWPSDVYNYVISVGGVQTEAAYPYCIPPLGNCYVCMVDNNKTQCGPNSPDYCNTTCHFDQSKIAASISNWTRVSQDEDVIAAYLVQHGPLSVLMNAEWLTFYSRGVSDPIFCSPIDLDHAVTIVGYGVDGDKPYWTVKNSWGTSFGENGYFRIIRGKGKCGINTVVTSSIV